MGNRKILITLRNSLIYELENVFKQIWETLRGISVLLFVWQWQQFLRRNMGGFSRHSKGAAACNWPRSRSGKVLIEPLQQHTTPVLLYNSLDSTSWL